MQDFGHQQYHAYKFHLQPAFTRFKSESKAHSAVAMVGGERSEVLSRPWQNSRSIPLPLKRLHENLLNLKRWWMKMFGRNLSNYCRSLEAERHKHTHDQINFNNDSSFQISRISSAFIHTLASLSKSSSAACLDRKKQLRSEFHGFFWWEFKLVCMSYVYLLYLSHMIPGHKISKNKSSQSVLEKPHWIKHLKTGYTNHQTFNKKSSITTEAPNFWPSPPRSYLGEKKCWKSWRCWNLWQMGRQNMRLQIIYQINSNNYYTFQCSVMWVFNSCLTVEWSGANAHLHHHLIHWRLLPRIPSQKGNYLDPSWTQTQQNPTGCSNIDHICLKNFHGFIFDIELSLCLAI